MNEDIEMEWWRSLPGYAIDDVRKDIRRKLSMIDSQRVLMMSDIEARAKLLRDLEYIEQIRSEES